MGKGWFESDEEYEARTRQEADEKTIEDLTGDTPSKGWFESEDDYKDRISKEADEARIESSTGDAPSKGWLESDTDYRDRIEREANEAVVEDATGETPSRGWLESYESYTTRIRREANEAALEHATGESPSQGWLESDHDYRSRIAHEVREARANRETSGEFETSTSGGSGAGGGGSAGASGCVGIFVLLLIVGGLSRLFGGSPGSAPSTVPPPPRTAAPSTVVVTKPPPAKPLPAHTALAPLLSGQTCKGVVELVAFGNVHRARSFEWTLTEYDPESGRARISERVERWYERTWEQVAELDAVIDGDEVRFQREWHGNKFEAVHKLNDSQLTLVFSRRITPLGLYPGGPHTWILDLKNSSEHRQVPSKGPEAEPQHSQTPPLSDQRAHKQLQAAVAEAFRKNAASAREAIRSGALSIRPIRPGSHPTPNKGTQLNPNTVAQHPAIATATPKPSPLARSSVVEPENEPERLYQLAVAATDGPGTMSYLLQAAEQGHVKAAIDLGHWYFNGGPGIQQDLSAARKWLTIAADAGDTMSQGYLGAAYLLGLGGEKDYELAFKYTLPAAQKGVHGSMKNVADMYSEGQGVRRNRTEAHQWYVKALAAYTKDQAGVPEAAYIIGRMHELGQGTKADDREALRWFRKGADAGHAKCQRQVGVFLYSGRGDRKDRGRAIEFLRYAAAQEDTQAREFLKQIGK